MSGKKLNYLYEHGLTVNFDDKDKIVFISDIHRGDGTFSDSFLLTHLLEDILTFKYGLL